MTLTGALTHKDFLKLRKYRPGVASSPARKGGKIPIGVVYVAGFVTIRPFVHRRSNQIPPAEPGKSVGPIPPVQYDVAWEACQIEDMTDPSIKPWILIFVASEPSSPRNYGLVTNGDCYLPVSLEINENISTPVFWLRDGQPSRVFVVKMDQIEGVWKKWQRVMQNLTVPDFAIITDEIGRWIEHPYTLRWYGDTRQIEKCPVEA